ncbi:MAG: Hsp20/alpha crystallin family protein [Alphaproteobacteria bacterium]|nr:Hsp20/alpha crystallin family protein [Alphaproteobacteria bacterium]
MTLRDLTPWFSRTTENSRQWLENSLDTLHRDVDRLFGDFLTGTDLSSWSSADGTGRLVPKMDVAELENAYEITADLPGLEEKDVDVSISEGVLHLKGERKS